MNDEMFEQLLASVREGGAILQGKATPARTFVIEGPDIKRIRARYQLSQSQFAALLGISPATLRNWEQGRRTPEGPARVLLQVAAKHPEALLDSIPHTEENPGKKVANTAKRTRKTTIKR
jgi:putative transcriptional regulator